MSNNDVTAAEIFFSMEEKEQIKTLLKAIATKNIPDSAWDYNGGMIDMSKAYMPIGMWSKLTDTLLDDLKKCLPIRDAKFQNLTVIGNNLRNVLDKKDDKSLRVESYFPRYVPLSAWNCCHIRITNVDDPETQERLFAINYELTTSSLRYELYDSFRISIKPFSHNDIETHDDKQYAPHTVFALDCVGTDIGSPDEAIGSYDYHKLATIALVHIGDDDTIGEAYNRTLITCSEGRTIEVNDTVRSFIAYELAAWIQTHKKSTNVVFACSNAPYNYRLMRELLVLVGPYNGNKIIHTPVHDINQLYSGLMGSLNQVKSIKADVEINKNTPKDLVQVTYVAQSYIKLKELMNERQKELS